MKSNQEYGHERRRCLRQSLHSPAFASFDGVSGGMILDLSEEGLSMQTGSRFHGQWLESERRVRLDVELTEPSAHLKTTGYIAWADALGRAGVRFTDLPEEARRRLNEWLTINASAPSQIAPKVMLGGAAGWSGGGRLDGDRRSPLAISLEAEGDAAGSLEPNKGGEHSISATVQYEFNSLGNDLSAALRQIGERARSLTRGSSAAIALQHKGAMICRASIGESAPALGTRLDVNSGLSGECIRQGKALRCDDAENDPRVDLESCQRLGVRSIVAAPVRFERDTIGVLIVFAPASFNFDEGDVAVVESLAHTIVRSMRKAELLRQGA